MTKSTFIILALAIGLTSCSDNDPVTDDPNNGQTELYTNVLTNVADKVITETYIQLAANASVLNAKAQLLTVGDEAALETAKEAWVNTRSPWEKSEGFLYGPVETNGIDPAIDSWPVDVNAINNTLQSGDPITSSVLESNNEARGFHTLEYLLWGLEGDKSASELTTREIEYIMATSQNLLEKTEQLANSWAASGGDYAINFREAGQASSIYSSQETALMEMAEGMQAIADEVANGKIETPLNGNNGGPKPQAEESRFSNNSKLDFADNIRSIQNVYLGQYNGSQGPGISAIIATNNPTLDATLKTAISDAILAIENIPGTFTDAIVNNRAAVENAQNKVLAVLEIIQNQVLPALSNLD
jgi:predicted lipoprotein